MLREMKAAMTAPTSTSEVQQQSTLLLRFRIYPSPSTAIMAYQPRAMRYSIHLPPSDLNTPPPAYRLPALVTTYSHLPDRSIQHDDTSMAYWSPAPAGADLNHGFEERIERDEDVEEHLDGLCEALRRAAEDGPGAERAGGIITWRGMITR